MTPLGLGHDMAERGGEVLKMLDNEPSRHNQKNCQVLVPKEISASLCK